MIAIWARRVVERLEKGGVASGPILQAMGIDHRSIGRRGSRLPQASLLALIEHAADRLNDPFFGLRLGYERDPRDAGVLTFIGLNELTLAHYLGDVQSY